MRDPRLIKNSILRKLGIEGGCDRYLFFHENGKNSDVPLTDNELSYICQISDHSSTNRILVKPILEHYKSYSKDGTKYYDFAIQHQRPNNQHYYNNDYDNIITSPVNVNGQFTMATSPQENLDTNMRDYFDKNNNKNLPPPPTWITQSQRSSTSSTETHTSHHYSQQNTNLWPVQNSETTADNNPNALWPLHQDTPQPEKQPSLWAVPPSNRPAEQPSLWAVPPSKKPEEVTAQKPVSLWAVPPSEKPQEDTTAPSLWAVSPKLSKADAPHLTKTNSSSSSDSATVVNGYSSGARVVPPNAPAVSLWAVPPKTQDNNSDNESVEQQFSAENIDLHPSISAKTDNQEDENKTTEKPLPRVVHFLSETNPDEPSRTSNTSIASAPNALEDVMEHMSINESKKNGLCVDTTARSTSPAPSSSSPTVTAVDSDEDNWAERPSVERLYKDIEKYLPGHDLDREIIVEPTPVMVNALPPGRKLQGHKKSIRNVVNEAHRNWRNAINVVRANNLIRRRSTKMWHRAVEQVKPGMKANIQQSGDLPKSRKLQWIRGELIGKGSFGRVYHALNVEAGEWIAVKQVDIPTTKSDYANPQMKEMKDALFREISLLEDLDNEYIVQYLGYNLDEEEGHINIFLEYVPGGSIASCLSKTGKFEIPLVQFFTRQILLGLAYLHNRNILHRDIKAGNILLNENGICKITDFGLSKLSGQDKAYDPHSNNSVMRGTVFWMAPEVVKGTNYNAKVDIWSLGCTVIEMLTGSHPWLDLNMLAALYNLGKYQAPPIPEDITEDARDFLNKCFTINPEERPTAEQLLEHSFVQPDPTFEFKKYMKKAEIERRASRRKQIEQQQ
ncbi:Putative STE/STE11 protein kinase [Rhizopus microsporus]|nr:Putative STE/STE11 protein kinase [Rhizopus microsporus]